MNPTEAQSLAHEVSQTGLRNFLSLSQATGHCERELARWWFSLATGMSHPESFLRRVLRLNLEVAVTAGEAAGQSWRLVDAEQQFVQEQLEHSRELSRSGSLAQFQSRLAELTGSGDRFLRGWSQIMARMAGRWMDPWAPFWGLPDRESEAIGPAAHQEG
jgi:hypothetical protein